MKTLRRGSTHRVMTPMEFMGRLAILVPPPYFPLTRYHGVFAARSAWRPLVTPKLPEGVVPRERKSLALRKSPPAGDGDGKRNQPRDGAGLEKARPPSPPKATATDPSLAPVVLRASDDPTLLTVKHWGRLLDGQLLASGGRLEWAVLLKRTHGLDSLECPSCHDRLRPLETLAEPHAVQAILSRLGLPTEPLPRARARDPTEPELAQQHSFDFDAA